MKVFSTKNKITMVSRQSNEPSKDMQLLREQLERDTNFKVVVLAKKLEKGLGSSIGYLFHMFRQMFNFATSKVVIADSYCIAISVLHHKKSLKVVQTWHALSAIKEFGHQTVGRQDGASALIANEMKMHKNYDYVLCSSDITAKYFCQAFDIEPSKIVKLGLPRIDFIKDTDAEMMKCIKGHYEQLDNGKKNVLYAPTFRKGRRTQVRELISAMDFERFNLIVKLHPLDNSCQDMANTENVIYDNQFDSYEFLKLADVVISDYSSFVVETSLLEKPLYLYLYDYEEYKELNGLNFDYEKEEINKYAFKNAKDLANEMKKPYDLEVVENLRERYIDVNTLNCTGQISNFIKKIANEY